MVFQYSKLLESYIYDIVLSSQVIHLSSNVEGDNRERWDLLTVNHVLQEKERENMFKCLSKCYGQTTVQSIELRVSKLTFTSPIIKGRAPMAFCSALISFTGPVIRDVPVSTIA